jgi:hypothetical protein
MKGSYHSSFAGITMEKQYHRDIPPAGRGGTYEEWLRYQEKEQLRKLREEKQAQARRTAHKMRAIGQSRQDSADKSASSATGLHDERHRGDRGRPHPHGCWRGDQGSKAIAMRSAPLQYRSIQQLVTDLYELGFSDTAIARFIDCRPETIARVRSGEQSGRNIAQRLLILADAYNLCRLSH